ncbi:NAD(P)H-binding protein [Aeromonas dhakensis]|uniref:NAD(P)H-binding protein n=1 Tax=Aeromonas dhakensis TaxID=196024 RepID=UPI00208EBD2A|nr:NAD(P)H-binding protein [Aeromonas dhakensis]USP11869.1 NAD(P)H-binding protein [Aeromonas dhakensis]
MQATSVLIVGVGGLGTCMVREAIERGLHVSVLVRDKTKLEAALGSELEAKLDRVVVGDGTNPQVLDDALASVDVVLSGRGADPYLARELAAAVKRNEVKKLCWPGGTTNVLADDGVTPNYKRLLHLGSWVEGAYQAHGACIDSIRQVGINYVIFCPGRMAGVGQRSQDVQASVRINRDAGPFVSYEDAAWVMLEAATTQNYDRQLVSAATEH